MILDLLSRSKLPLAGVEDHVAGFTLVFREQALAGCAALERYGPVADRKSTRLNSSHRL